MSSQPQIELRELMGKRLWVRYRLQSLTTPRFIRTANRILKGQDLLLNERPENPGPAAASATE
ncbi:MAG: hypothetical protein ABIJ61_09355 [bacterium]